MHGFLAEHLGVFDPDDIRTLVGAFDKAWEAVQASGAIFDKAKADSARAILAKHIIAAVKAGEFDQGRLRDGALVALAQAKSANRAPATVSRPELAQKISQWIVFRARSVALFYSISAARGAAARPWSNGRVAMRLGRSEIQG